MTDYNWRSVSVNRSKEFEPLVERFAKPEIGKVKIFTNIKDFMVFAALVGFEYDLFEEIDTKDKISISLETYSNTDHDAYIYLLALHKTNSIDVLKNESLNDTVKIFEGYCNAGLIIIRSWVDKNPSNEDGIDIFFNEIYEHITR